MSRLTQIAMANYVSSKTNAVSLIIEKNIPHIFPQQSLFPKSTVLHITVSLSSSSHPCFFHCCVSPTELLWAHMVPSATDLLHSRAMFIKETRESASYGLSHITYSIPPEAGHVFNPNTHRIHSLSFMSYHYPDVKYDWVFIWDK